MSNSLEPPTLDPNAYPNKQATYDPMFWKMLSPPETKWERPSRAQIQMWQADILNERRITSKGYPESWDLIPKDKRPRCHSADLLECSSCRPKFLKESDHYKEQLKDLNIDPEIPLLGRAAITILLSWFPITTISIFTSLALGGWAYTISLSTTIFVIGVSLLARQLRKESKNMDLRLKPILVDLIETQIELEALQALEAAGGAYVTHEKFPVENSSTKQIPTS